MRKSFRQTAAALLIGGVSVVVASCASTPSGPADERWADFKSWTKITEGNPQTGDETGFIGNVHKGPSGYRDVYVNDIGAAMLEGEGPYNFPAGTVVVKEQFNNKAAWESGEGGAVTVSVKAESTDAVAKENWIWATSYNAKAGASAFCSGCHSIAAKDDFVFTHGAFLASQ